MELVYKVYIDEEINGGLDAIRHELDKTILRFGFDVFNSSLETPEEWLNESRASL